jgi:rRNA maturation protein Nop10
MHREGVLVEKASTKYCRHVYEYVGSEICPDCGGYTHEPDMQLQIQLYRQYYAEGKHLKYKCDHCGGTLRVWWDI